MMCLADLLLEGQNSLKPHTDEWHIEAERLLFHCFDLDKACYLLNKTNPIENECQLNDYRAKLKLRATGKPLAYILKQWPFLAHDYNTQEGVLIPRPETEILALKIIDLLNLLTKEYNEEDLRILELGFGTGVLSIECQKAFPKLNIMAWDINPIAVDLAKENAIKLDCKNIQFIHKDFFKDQAVWHPTLNNSKPCLIISNPPYIPSKELETLQSEVKDFEPHEALDGGESGFDFYEKLLSIVPAQKNNFLFLECGIYQAVEIANMAFTEGFSDVNLFRDYEGVLRVIRVF